jgi:uncharacterized OsmC-like protein
MDATELRELQSPLKRKYRDDPAAAATPLRAEGDFSAGGITATVSGWAGPVRAGLHPATGGDGSDACSGDMLLQAVLACAGVTLRSVATALDVNIRGAELHAIASFDARGTLGVSRESPVGIQGLAITVRLDTDASEATLVKLGELTERYCVVGRASPRSQGSWSHALIELSTSTASLASRISSTSRSPQSGELEECQATPHLRLPAHGLMRPTRVRPRRASPVAELLGGLCGVQHPFRLPRLPQRELGAP